MVVSDASKCTARGAVPLILLALRRRDIVPFPLVWLVLPDGLVVVDSVGDVGVLIVGD